MQFAISERLAMVARALAVGLVAAGFVVFALAAKASMPERRVALVLGNGAYQHVPTLENPLVDAKAISASLKRLGFEVVEGYDQKLDAMRMTVGEFAAKLDGAKVGLVYYAGHGIAVAGENYLLPVDAVLKSETDVDFRTLNISLVLRQMQRENRVNVVILDACRDNPFAKELARSLKTRSTAVGSGLSEINTSSAAGTLIAFATNPGETALDGTKGNNSPFTTALLKHIETPGVSISTVFDRVRGDVWQATNEKQRPWVNTSIIGEFYLNPQAPAATAQVAALSQPGLAAPATPAAVVPGFDRQAMDFKLWESAERVNTIDGYKAYLESFPTGAFAAVAKANLAKLQGPAPAKPTFSEDDLKREAGTAQTEAAAEFKSPKDRTEAQHRLRLAGFNPNGTSGTFGPGTRKAIAEWQRSRSIPETGYFTKTQRLALWDQSETSYQAWLQNQTSERSVGVVRAPRPTRQEAQAGAEPAPRQAPRRAPAQQGGPSLGEVGQFLGGVGGVLNGVGSMRRW